MLIKQPVKLITWGIIPFILILIVSCNSVKDEKSHRKVVITKTSGKYTLYRDGKPFYIKGAAGQTNLKRLQEIGGNTIRTYDTINLGAVLDDAQKNHLAVVVGLPIPESEYSPFIYDKPAMRARQFADIQGIVNRYKSHPAVLMWCVGNELDFSPNPRFYNFYRSFNNIVKMIHEDDPDHPVTTTMNNLYPKNLVCISLFTDIDVLSSNFFKSLDELEGELKKVSLIWRGPFLLTEWGIDGPWNSKRNAWGVRIEETSNKKAERYRNVYQYVPVNHPYFLGAFVFYWGSKQETTHTWFSMFDDQGRESEAIGVMEYCWTGKNTQPPPPDLNYMLVNGKGAMGNIILKPGEVAEALLEVSVKDSSNITHWEIYPEDWFYPNNTKNDQRLKPVSGHFTHTEYLKASFKAPIKEGPYRIFATVQNKAGKIASCNTPFYVVSNR